MKKIFSAVIIFFTFECFAQEKTADSLIQLLQNTSGDSSRYTVNMLLSFYYQELDRDSALYFADNATQLAHKNNKKLAEAAALGFKGYQLTRKGSYAEALDNFQRAFLITDSINAKKNSWFFSPGGKAPSDDKIYTLSRLQDLYAELMHATKNAEQEIFYLNDSKKNGEKINDPYRIAIALENLGDLYSELNKPDSAINYLTEALDLMNQSQDKKYIADILTVTAKAYMKQGVRSKAKQCYYDGMHASIFYNNLANLAYSYYGLSKYYYSEGNKDSSLSYGLKALEIQKRLKTSIKNLSLDDIYENISRCFQLQSNFDSAFKYQGLALAAKDSIAETETKNLADFQNIGFKEQMRLRDVERQRIDYQNKITNYAMLAGIGVFMLTAFLLYINNRNRKKANELLQKQNAEIELQKKNLEDALSNLKSTQAQLIHSEKMASLGELTAGIAHEIQNPLNFVNNFSEVNNELIEELKSEKSTLESEEHDEILNDIFQNNDKISFHGKRADAIVKGMLQHSRTSTGQKESTDINALADEYLRLAYHGLRAKEKSFNATLRTDFDKTIGIINVVPQDMGRVLLNLFNNAFYSVTQKQKELSGRQSYVPTVKVVTKKLTDKIEIRVADNGNGIPQKIVDKIFQPFFTTKPTGQGTGLGLSLSYDIIKAHRGEIKVETKEGEGSEFIIRLPV